MSAWIGTIEFDLLLGDVHSLKQKRSFVRPLASELRRRFAVAVAETDHQDLHRRAAITVVSVAGDQQHVIDVLDAVEHFMSGRRELDLLSSHRTFHRPDDD